MPSFKPPGCPGRRGGITTRFTFLAAAAIAAALAGAGSASHCTDFSTSEPEVAAFGFYVDNDPCQPECLFSIWSYQETNGIEGLQRGDEMRDDTCHGVIDADTISPY